MQHRIPTWFGLSFVLLEIALFVVALNVFKLISDLKSAVESLA